MHMPTLSGPRSHLRQARERRGRDRAHPEPPLLARARRTDFARTADRLSWTANRSWPRAHHADEATASTGDRLGPGLCIDIRRGS